MCLVSRLQQMLYLQKQSQMQTYFNQMHIVEGTYTTCPPMNHQDPVAPSQTHQQQNVQPFGSIMEPSTEPSAYDPYSSHYAHLQAPVLPVHLQIPQHYTYQTQKQYEVPLEPGHVPQRCPQVPGNDGTKMDEALPESEMMETVDGIVLVN